MKLPIYLGGIAILLALAVVALNVPLPSHQAIAEADTPRLSYSVIDAQGKGRVAIGDINGDGKNDIALHSWGEDISWYEYPSWKRRVIASGVAQGGDEIQLADMDGDGDLDLVGPWHEKSKVKWFENPARSSETSHWTPHVIGDGVLELKDLHIADLDGDGRPDIVSRHHDRIMLFFQTGPDEWMDRTIRIVEREGMAIGDLDGDGDIDIAANGFWLENPPDPREANWTRHNIDALWYEMQGGGWRDNGVKVVIADINRDGRMDVVFSASERARGDWPIAWYEAVDPKGGPSAWTKHVVGYLTNAHTLQVADFDRDGAPDILSCRLRDSSYLPAFIFFNRNNRWEQKKIHEGGCYSGKVGDIDDDGDPDFVSSRNWKEPPLYLIRNEAASAARKPAGKLKRHFLGALTDRAMFVQSGDLDGDGKPDIAAGGEWWRNPGQPGGRWLRQAIGEPLYNAFAIHDFDGDGDLDILGTQGRGAAQNHRFAWARNDGTGTFKVLTNIENAGSGDFLQGRAVADFGSGTQIALSWHNGGGGTYLLTVPKNPSDEKWPVSLLSEVTQSEDLSTGDIDRDGDLDLLLGTVWLRNDNGAWTALTLGEVRRGVPDRSRLADIDGDGDLDAVVALENGTDVYWFEAPADPEKSWPRHLIGEAAGQGFSMDITDLDGDGDPDVVVGEHRGKQQNRVLFFMNSGHGRDWEMKIADTASTNEIDHHDGTQAVDIDGDGDIDLLSIGWYNPKLWLFEALSNPAAPSGG